MSRWTRPGIDISEHNGDVDFGQVRRAGTEFCVIRASYGETDRDGRFGTARVNAARRAGLRVGFYHYAYPSGGDAKREAQNFVRAVKATGGWRRGDLKPVLDVEESKIGPTHIWVGQFVAEVKRLTGLGCIIYTGSFWRDEMGDPDSGFGCPLWLAAYTSSPEPYVPRAWRSRRWRWAIWQYTGSGRVAGVSGDCDRNVRRITWTFRTTVGPLNRKGRR